MSGDIYYEKVSLLLHGEGYNGGSVVTDSSRYVHTATNTSVTTSTTQKSQGFSSLLFNGTTSVLSYKSSEEFNLTGDFTIEASVYLTGYCTTPFSGIYYSAMVVCKDEISKRSYNFSIRGSVNSYTSLVFGIFSGGEYYELSGLFNFALNAWHIVSVKKSGTNYKLYVNNVEIASAVITQSIDSTTANLNVGAQLFQPTLSGNTAKAYYFPGLIDEVRLTNGIARDLTVVQTEAFPDYSGQISYTLTESLAATQFRLIANKISDGALAKTAVITASGTLDMPLLDAVSLVAVPVQGNKWQSGTVYAAGRINLATNNGVVPVIILVDSTKL